MINEELKKMINEELNKEENVKIEDIDWESVSHGEKTSFSSIQFLADMYGNSVTVSKEIYSAKLETMFISVVIVLVGLLLKMSMVGIICTVGVYMFLSTILAAFKEGAARVLHDDALILLRGTLLVFKKKYPSSKK